MSDRDCKNCKHHTDKGCDSWDCEFERRITRKEAIKKLKDILEEATETDDSVCYVTADDADALKAAINSLEIDERYELECERCCNDCILYETDACTRAGRAVNDEPCEDFIGAESEGEE